VIVAALAAALALPAAAGAASVVTLRVNDEFGVKKSHILCAVQISKSLLPGKKLVICFYVPKDPTKGPVPGTYAVALATNGEAVLAKVGASGQITIVKKLGGKPGPSQGPLERNGKLFKVAVGAALAVKSSAIRCGVTTQEFGGKKQAKTVGCFKVGTNGKPRPNSYGIGITDGGAFLVHFDAQSKGMPVKVVQHGH
jgi:hypothetical protein